MEFHTAGVIGGGAWGTALAQSAAAAGLAVVLQAREPEVIESIRTRRMNDAFLPGIELDSAINVTSDLADLADCDLILAVPPAQHMRATLAAFAPYARPGQGRGQGDRHVLVLAGDGHGAGQTPRHLGGEAGS